MAAGSIVEQPDERTAPGGAADGMRAHLHGMWAAVAGAWEEHAEFTDARGAHVTELMLDLTLVAPGERVLELACGAGAVGLAAAARVAPGGEVVLSDVVAEMTSIAAARARALGLHNVSTRELDIEQIDEPDGSYDVVLCREGLMFAPDAARAAREIGRVLRPGGRCAVAVWGPRERNPWLSTVFDAVGAQLGRPVPPPGVPGPFSLSDASALADLLQAAGLRDVAVSEIPVPMSTGSFEEWWSRTAALAGPLSKLLEALDEEATRAIAVRVRAAAGPYTNAAGELEFPGLTLLATGRRGP